MPLQRQVTESLAALISTENNGEFQVPSQRRLTLFDQTKKAADGPQIDTFELDLGSKSMETTGTKEQHMSSPTTLSCNQMSFVWIRKSFKKYFGLISRHFNIIISYK